MIRTIYLDFAYSVWHIYPCMKNTIMRGGDNYNISIRDNLAENSVLIGRPHLRGPCAKSFGSRPQIFVGNKSTRNHRIPDCLINRRFAGISFFFPPLLLLFFSPPSRRKEFKRIIFLSPRENLFHFFRPYNLRYIYLSFSPLYPFLISFFPFSQHR